MSENDIAKDILDADGKQVNLTRRRGGAEDVCEVDTLEQVNLTRRRGYT